MEKPGDRRTPLETRKAKMNSHWTSVVSDILKLPHQINNINSQVEKGDKPAVQSELAQFDANLKNIRDMFFHLEQLRKQWVETDHENPFPEIGGEVEFGAGLPILQMFVEEGCARHDERTAKNAEVQTEKAKKYLKAVVLSGKARTNADEGKGELTGDDAIKTSRKDDSNSTDNETQYDPGEESINQDNMGYDTGGYLINHKMRVTKDCHDESVAASSSEEEEKEKEPPALKKPNQIRADHVKFKNAQGDVLLEQKLENNTFGYEARLELLEKECRDLRRTLNEEKKKIPGKSRTSRPSKSLKKRCHTKAGRFRLRPCVECGEQTHHYFQCTLVPQSERKTNSN